ncbi:hypothetical protein KIN20_022528 [Parelaphostrongylus tenuis]|uniref:Uncharacterized protein n=1 Tax=Parelaphostrongylus tenuis TaxID=148309 RepID=A0AAD5N831_PARTN|nr:hypothetical protein KIN20_022528 [Parelaphostrongylus tenuis]
MRGKNGGYAITAVTLLNRVTRVWVTSLFLRSVDRSRELLAESFLGIDSTNTMGITFLLGSLLLSTRIVFCDEGETKVSLLAFSSLASQLISREFLDRSRCQVWDYNWY